jgi:hypothetical protein
MLEVTSEDIANLADDDLRSLVGQLCEADLRAHGFPASAVTWGGNQNAADGGVDVRLSLPPDKLIGGFLPRARIGLQVKKTDFTPAMIAPEMRPSGILRSSIAALALENGAYIIVSSGTNASDSALSDRIKAMRDAVHNADSAEALLLDFYDRSRLATWVRSHPGLMLWVRRRIGKAVSGWRGYDAWALSPEGIHDTYLTNDEARIHVETRDEHGIPITDGINRIRDVLRQPRGVVRLTGLSGVGKTRLLQALFDDRVASGSLDPALALYTDMSDNPDPQPTGMAHDLIATRNRAIVIVDNCAPDLHRRVSEVCRAADSTVSVITVEYDIRDDEPEGTEVFRLEPSTPGLVADLIERRFPDISKVDANTIGEFSGGNARTAIALANTLAKKESLAGLQDEDLFTRLFHQRQGQDESLLMAAQACALLYSFQGEALTGAAAELPVIATLIGSSAQNLFARVAELKRRDLVQKRGEWRAVLPHAIANRLAVMALQKIPLEIIEGQFTTERLLRSFSRRLGYLHDSEEALRVVTKWLAPDGLLNDVAHLNDLGMAMFNNIAPVAPTVTLAAIERALSTLSAQGTTPQKSWRDRMAYLLRSLAHDASLFERCFAGLMKIADAEPDNSQSRPAHEALKSLMHLYLSGTHASVEQRLNLIAPLLHSAEPAQRSHGVELLRAMLEASHFSSSYGFEFGAHTRDWGYVPKTRSEEQHWYLHILAVVRPLACSDLPVADMVRSELASAFRGLWYKGDEVQSKLEEIAHAILQRAYWQQGWIAVRMIITYGPEDAPEEWRARLRALETLLRPKNIIQQVQAIVLSQSSGGLDIADSDEDDDKPLSSYERANAAAEELGKEVSKDQMLLSTLLPNLVKGDGGHGGRLASFGMGLAAGASDRPGLWNTLTQAFATAPADNRHVGVFCGFLMGTNKSDGLGCELFLEEALHHETLASCFPVLQTAVPITERGAQRLKEALAMGKAPVWQFRFLGWGRASDVITGADLKELLLLIARLPDGYAVATDILSMRFHSERDKKVVHLPELIEAGRTLLSEATFDNRDNMHDYRMSMIIKACLPGEGGIVAARSVCEKFKAGLSDYSVYIFHYDQMLAELFRAQPRIALDVFLGDGSENSDSIDTHGFEDPLSHHKNPVDAVATNELLGWCERDPDTRYIAVAKSVSFFEVSKDTPPQWAPIALELMNAAPQPTKVLEVFIDRFSPRSWSGSRATIIESRAKLLDTLIDHPNSAIATMAREKRPILHMATERERKREKQRDRERDERFE